MRSREMNSDINQTAFSEWLAYRGAPLSSAIKPELLKEYLSRASDEDYCKFMDSRP
jgi:hypothetical protein